MKKEVYAFPLALNVDEKECKGMTLRDYFANSAMQTLVSKRDTTYDSRRINCDLDITTARDLTRHAYQIADAMLKQREL